MSPELALTPGDKSFISCLERANNVVDRNLVVHRNLLKSGSDSWIPDLHVKVDDLILAEGNTVVAQVWVIGGPHAVEVSGIIKKGHGAPIPQLFLLRIDQNGKIARPDCYFDNTVLGGVRASAL